RAGRIEHRLAEFPRAQPGEDSDFVDRAAGVLVVVNGRHDVGFAVAVHVAGGNPLGVAAAASAGEVRDEGWRRQRAMRTAQHDSERRHVVRVRPRERHIREAVAVEIGGDQVVTEPGDAPAVSLIVLEGTVAAAQRHLALPIVVARFEDVERPVSIEVGENHVARWAILPLQWVNGPGGEGAIALAIERPDLSPEVGEYDVHLLVAVDVGDRHQPRERYPQFGDNTWDGKLTAA